MAVAARKRIETRSTTPRLRLVHKAGPKRRSAASIEARARHNFVTFACVIVVVSTLAIGRIWVTVQATEISRASNQLRDSIKTERYAGDMLEVRQSALGSPSRIQAIAGKAMNMTPATEVTYLDLTSKKAPAEPETIVPGSPAKNASTKSAFEELVATVMDLTAGEAQVLLVGDVGVASTR